MKQPQSFANHTRFHAPYHFFAVPILAINVLWRIVELVRNPSGAAAWEVAVSLALAAMILLVRTYPLKVQDRVIRLEERMRLERLMPAGLSSKVPEFSAGQLCALRFCADDEVSELAGRILNEGTLGRAEIKRQIKTWKPDEFRI